MAKSDRIRNGLDHWRQKARQRAGAGGAPALISQLENMATLLHECAHDGERSRIDSSHAVCHDCKWIQHEPSGAWEPMGFRQ